MCVPLLVDYLVSSECVEVYVCASCESVYESECKLCICICARAWVCDVTVITKKVYLQRPLRVKLKK